MSDVSKINIDNIDYDIKDELSRNPNWDETYEEGSLPVAKEYVGTSIHKIRDILNDFSDDYATKNELSTAVTALQTNFQTGVDLIVEACEDKGSTPAGQYPYTPQAVADAIDAIQTGGNYMTKEIREDGTYYASDDGVDAYDIVVVSKDVGQPHTVVFYGPDGNIIKIQANVPYHGYATCTSLDGTTRNGLYFKGWNPSPTNIIRDTFCYPQYGEYIIDSGEIQDDWETICAVNGAGYPLGSYKAFVVGMTIPANEIMCYGIGHSNNAGAGYLPRENWGFSPNVDLPLNFSFHMVKVAEGEDNSTSTWLSDGGFVIPINVIPYSRWRDGSGEWVKQDGNVGLCITDFGDWYAYTQPGGYRTIIAHDWGSSFLRNFLNGFFFDHLAPCFKDAIKEVNKSYKGYNTDIYKQNPSRVEKTSLDKIWVPSVKELGARLELCTIGNMSPNTFADIVEINGIDYSNVYVPTYPYPSAGSSEYAVTRTSVRGSSNLAWDYNVVRMNTVEANALQSASYKYSNNTSQRYIPLGFCL